MSSRFFTGVVSAFVMIGLLAALTGRTMAEELRYKFTAGQMLSFTMEQSTDTAFKIGDRDVVNHVKQKTYMIWDIKDVSSNNIATIEQVIKRMYLEVKSPVAGGSFVFDTDTDEPPSNPSSKTVAELLTGMVGSPFVVKMTNTGEITDLKIPEKVLKALKQHPQANQLASFATEKGFRQMVEQSSLSFPAGDLEVGREWSKAMQMGGDKSPMKVTINTTYRYDGIAKVDGKDMNKFNVDIHMEFGDGPNVPKIVSQETSGTLYFDNEAGHLNSGDISIKMVMTIDVLGKTTEMKVDQNVKMTVEEVKDAKPAE